MRGRGGIVGRPRPPRQGRLTITPLGHVVVVLAALMILAFLVVMFP